MEIMKEFSGGITSDISNEISRNSREIPNVNPDGVPKKVLGGNPRGFAIGITEVFLRGLPRGIPEKNLGGVFRCIHKGISK